jgi:hypothetical protein
MLAIGYGPAVLDIGDPLIDSGVWVAYAAFVLGIPLVFLAVVIVTGLRRRGSGTVGPQATLLITATGGLTLGALVPVSSDLVVVAPILVAGAFIVYALWRRLRRLQAGWFLVGFALPSAALGLLAGMRMVERGLIDTPRIALLLLPVAALLVGVAIVGRGEPPPPSPDIAAPAGRPGSRAFGNIAAAIRDPARLGPFGVPELAMLVAVVATVLIVPILLPGNVPALARSLIVGVAASAVATEVYVRAWPSAARRAFEAFSWFGEWELAQARQLTGERVPSSRRGALSWLARRPDRPDERPLRIEMLLYVGRDDEARGLLDQLEAATPWDRFNLAALHDLVDWHAGGEGDLAAMESAAAAIQPIDGDERLRAEVAIATAKVRRRMAEGRPTPEEVVEPLLQVRERLGRRADGQVGRAFRRRLFPVLLLGSIIIGVTQDVLGVSLP